MLQAGNPDILLTIIHRTKELRPFAVGRTSQAARREAGHRGGVSNISATLAQPRVVSQGCLRTCGRNPDNTLTASAIEGGPPDGDVEPRAALTSARDDVKDRGCRNPAPREGGRLRTKAPRAWAVVNARPTRQTGRL